MAWRCTRSELRTFLEGLGADRDAEGRFFLAWSQGAPGIGGQRSRNVVISDDMRYRIRGRWVPLAPALSRQVPDTLLFWKQEGHREQGAA